MSTAKAAHRKFDHRVQVARARRFLGERLGDEVELPAVARAAGASMFHLARLSRALTGETLGRARTRMRIEAAAAALLERPARPISQIALACGFQTPSSLGKAFRAALGISPTQFRASPVAERRARLSRLAASAGPSPDYTLSAPTIETRADLRVVYVRERGAYAQVSAPLAWEALERRVAGTPLAACPRIAASYDDAVTVPSGARRYDAAVIVDAKAAPPAGTRTAIWRGGRFAVFVFRGEYALIEHAFRRIFAAWPLEVKKRAEAPCLELYPAETSARAAPRKVAELWIPIE